MIEILFRIKFVSSVESDVGKFIPFRLRIGHTQRYIRPNPTRVGKDIYAKFTKSGLNVHSSQITNIGMYNNAIQKQPLAPVEVILFKLNSEHSTTIITYTPNVDAPNTPKNNPAKATCLHAINNRVTYSMQPKTINVSVF